jgi:hypothetical protein
MEKIYHNPPGVMPILSFPGKSTCVKYILTSRKAHSTDIRTFDMDALNSVWSVVILEPWYPTCRYGRRQYAGSPYKQCCIPFIFIEACSKNMCLTLGRSSCHVSYPRQVRIYVDLVHLVCRNGLEFYTISAFVATISRSLSESTWSCDRNGGTINEANNIIKRRYFL